MNEGEDSEKKFGSENQNISYIKLSQVMTCFFLALLVITKLNFTKNGWEMDKMICQKISHSKKLLRICQELGYMQYYW